MKIKTINNTIWARIYWLDVSSTKTVFSTTTAQNCIEANRFSMMQYVDSFKTSSGVYEFILTYPKLSSTLYNRWSQTSSPNVTGGKDNVTGYNPITITWTTQFGNGLRRTVSGSSVWNVAKSENWWSPVGQTDLFSSTGIPAADGSTQLETELWVRIDNINLSNLTNFKQYKNYTIGASDFIER